jgi:pyruvyltransferase
MKTKTKKIFMCWFKLEGKRQNFGDVLGPYLVEKLSGLKVVYVPLNCDSLVNSLRFIYRVIIKGQYSYLDLYGFIYSRISRSKTLLSIGSIIGHYSKINYYNVWGSGIIHSKAQIQDANFLAVRGKYTQKRLKELGYSVPNIIGDPALLLPLVYNPEIKKKFKLGIIPHYMQFEEITMLLRSHQDLIIIDLLDDIEKVVRDIKSCNFTISSSLHGIIVSHAYNVPSLWYNFPGAKLAGDNVKFLDYFSSLDIENYEPFIIADFGFIDVNEISKNVCNVVQMDAIAKKIAGIQKGLLDVAPFKIVEEYTHVKN